MSRSPESPRTTSEALTDALQGALPTLMRRAIAAARRADQPFGCVLADLKTGGFLAEASNSASSDPTAHAEINALRLLPTTGTPADRIVVVSTAEPCPMCAAACWWAGVGAIVFGTSIETLLRLGWRQLDLPADDLLALARPAGRPPIVGRYLAQETDPLYVRPSGP